MPIVAKATGGGRDFIPAPGGAHAAVCCDVVDMGVLEVSYGGNKKSQHKVRIVWQIAEVTADNKPYIVQKRYTLSLHKKSALLKDLESWRGIPFSDEQLQGFDLETLLGAACLLNVMQVQKEGDTYANVTTIMRLPKGMEAPKVRDYVRMKDRTPEQTAAAKDAQHAGDGMTDDPSYDGYFPTDDDVPF